MRVRNRTKFNSKYLGLVIFFVLLVTLPLGGLLIWQSKASLVELLHTRMLDASNMAAAILDGDALKDIGPEREETPEYELIMRTLTYFQADIELKSIYCVRDRGDGTFTLEIGPAKELIGKYGEEVAATQALKKAGLGEAAADTTPYTDERGSFYRACSPVLDSQGEVAAVVVADFDAGWYERQLAIFTFTTCLVAILSLLVGGAFVVFIVSRIKRRMGSLHGQLNEMAVVLMQEMGNAPVPGRGEQEAFDHQEAVVSMDTLEKQIQSMQSELRIQIAHIHGQANQDGLTGVKSKHAYLEMEKALDNKMEMGTLPGFGVVVCDVNGLKKVNDTLGHQAGDEYIRKSCKMICNVFAHSPVYRVGGDEFVALLTGRDYENRGVLMRELHKLSVSHIGSSEAIVSGGMAEYEAQRDHSIHEVFERADAGMYKEKTLLKSLGAVTRDDKSDREVYGGEEDLVLNIRRHILICDDIESNREMLGGLLEEDYDIYYASDGVETMEMLREHKDEIALVLLDLYMPNMTGREVIRKMQVDEELMGIPVIMLTVDQDAELDSLKMGAMDFISKPYPNIDIVKTRISKCIELSENRDLIRHTQRDKLTGLFNVDYFFRYVDRIDQQHRGLDYDALVCDVSRFHAVNETYGRQFGDLVLRSIGIYVRKLARKTGGIGCRQGGDTFLLYMPHQMDYEQLIRRFHAEVFVEKETAEKVKLRFGVFLNAGREPNLEERFACAKIAADSVYADTQQLCGYYGKGR